MRKAEKAFFLWISPEKTGLFCEDLIEKINKVSYNKVAY